MKTISNIIFPEVHLLDHLSTYKFFPHYRIGFQVERKSIAMPGKAVKLLEKVLEQMAVGNTVEITSVSDELTTQEAADLLNVSRPHLIKLLETGKFRLKR